MTYSLYTDGCRTAVQTVKDDNRVFIGGCILDYEGQSVAEFSMEKTASSHLFEDVALLQGLELATQMGIKDLKVYTDLKMHQSLFSPEGRARNEYQAAILNSGINIDYQWIEGRHNKRADALSRRLKKNNAFLSLVQTQCKALESTSSAKKNSKVVEKPTAFSKTVSYINSLATEISSNIPLDNLSVSAYNLFVHSRPHKATGSLQVGGYIKNPEGETVVEFSYEATNKDVQFFHHEGLLQGLQIAHDMGVNEMKVFTHEPLHKSMLMGEYKAKTELTQSILNFRDKMKLDYGLIKKDERASKLSWRIQKMVALIGRHNIPVLDDALKSSLKI